MLPRSSPEPFFAACAACAAAICLVVFASNACGPACDTSDAANPTARYDGGVITGGDDPYYYSSEWNQGLLHFPGGKRYELVHHLGFVPINVSVFVSFAENGEPLTPCAGNTCVLQAVKSDSITVKNDTCSEFWIRVVASGRPPAQTDAGAAD